MDEKVYMKRQRTETDAKCGVEMPEAVLSDQYTLPVTLVDMYVCQIKDKKDTSKVLRYLSTNFPLEKYPHLKRVRSNAKDNRDLYILVTSVAGGLTMSASLREDLSTFNLGPLQVFKIPEKPPLTRQQFEDSCQYWPVNFHENKSITKMLNGSYFDNETLLTMESHMIEAIRLAQVSRGKGQIPIGAVIVDSASNTVIAKSHDLRCQGNNPLHHATMVCIDMVARSQGGGMWNYQDGSDLYAFQKESADGEERSSLPYLCTGYDLFITQEPCIMCAMALLHSRINCVFYGSPITEGALGSKYKLHVTEGLNHHFLVFKGLLKEQCVRLHEDT